jgi:hypothetical protein
MKNAPDCYGKIFPSLLEIAHIPGQPPLALRRVAGDGAEHGASAVATGAWRAGR